MNKEKPVAIQLTETDSIKLHKQKSELFKNDSSFCHFSNKSIAGEYLERFYVKRGVTLSPELLA